MEPIQHHIQKHIIHIILKMDKKEVQQEIYMEYMIWQVALGSIWQVI